MLSSRKKLLSLDWWKIFYQTTPIVILRHILAFLLLFLGAMGVMVLCNVGGWINLLIAIGFFTLALLLAPEVSGMTLIGLALVGLFVLVTQVISISAAIVLGSIIIAGAIIFSTMSRRR